MTMNLGFIYSLFTELMKIKITDRLQTKDLLALNPHIFNIIIKNRSVNSLRLYIAFLVFQNCTYFHTFYFIL